MSISDQPGPRSTVLTLTCSATIGEYGEYILTCSIDPDCLPTVSETRPWKANHPLWSRLTVSISRFRKSLSFDAHKAVSDLMTASIYGISEQKALETTLEGQMTASMGRNYNFNWVERAKVINLIPGPDSEVKQRGNWSREFLFIPGRTKVPDFPPSSQISSSLEAYPVAELPPST